MDGRRKLITMFKSRGAAVYTISGTVYDADGTTAVASATVALGALSATSGVDGTYTISNVPAGTSGSMTCTKEGYSWTAKTIAAMSGSLTSQNYINAWWATGGIAASNLRAYQPIGASSIANSYVNLSNPGTGDATVVTGTPVWNQYMGWNFDGAFTLSSGAVPASGHTIIVLYARSSDGKVIAGSFDGGSTKIYIWPSSSGTNRRYDYAGGNRSVAGAKTLGVLALAGANCYVDGAADGAVGSSWSGTSTRPIWLGDLNYDGSNLRWTGEMLAYAHYNTTLSAPQIAALTAAMNLIPRPIYWQPAMPGTMVQHGMEYCNGKIYCAGGDAGKKLYEYDPTTRVWATKADLPFAEAFRQSAIMRSVGDKLYFIGGYNQNVPAYYASVYEYDPGTNAWDDSREPMPVELEDMGSAVIGSKIYIFGGLSGGNTPRTQMYVYDVDEDTWDSTKAAMPVAKALGDFGCACGGYVYAIGATNDMTNYPTELRPVSTVYKYNPATDQWATVATIPAGTCYTEAEVVGTKIYVFGGANAAFAATNAIYIYDTVANTWSTSSATIPTARYQAALCTDGTKIYMSGGYLTNALMYVYDPAYL